ncbi:MAG TPA: tripartite tricarboxylate transporter substrate binding protein [Xanthobacteraceae bacterium]|jgi:tripartite-type tricarboxylate transporter receptor subunit TctC|nr:tripartite tricarboxylate transporter substrate binding protein [Xanthobacteraceae bacterium]
MKKHLMSALLLLAASLMSVAAYAAGADTYPDRPVKLIVGFQPGGPTDLIARLIAQKLSEETGKNFIIENVAGAGGNVGAGRAAQSTPDGYTLLVTGGNLTNNPFLYSHVAFDPLKSFDAVTLAGATPVVLAVNPSVPAHSVKELVALIRSTPNKYSFASPGTGTPPQLVGSLFKQALDLDLVHVPFDGGGVAVEATVGGHTPISFGALAPALPLIKSGQLRALAVTGKERAPSLPDVPTMAEAGFPEVVGSTWTAVVAPAGTPKDIIAKLHDLIVKGLAQPDVKAKLASMAYVGIGNSPEECTQFFKDEMATWGKVIKDAGLHAE